MRTSWNPASKVRAILHHTTDTGGDDTTDKEVVSELLHRFSGLWSQPGVCRKEHLECAMVFCLEVRRDVRAEAEVFKPKQPWCVLTKGEECRTPENATAKTQEIGFLG